MGDTIVKLYQQQNFVMSEDILKLLKRNKLSLDDALLVTYFYNNNAHPLLNIEEIKNKFGLTKNEIMKSFENLSNKGLIDIKMEKNKDRKLEEIIDLTPLYKSLVLEIGEENKEAKSNDIFTLIEREIGKPLSSMEFEIINNWLDKNLDESMIKEAIKISRSSGNVSIRYIDAILSDWKRKGLKSSKDIDVYFNKNTTHKTPKKKEQLFDYNWLDDEDEN